MRILIALLAALCLGSSAFGVATVTNGTYGYNTTEPSTIANYINVTGTNRNGQLTGYSTTANFQSGWGTTSAYDGLSGWDYVGTIGGASCVYLGNGWVLTAKHVVSGASYTGSFTLSGSTYSVVSGSVVYIGDNTDLVMVYVGNAATISLPTLSLSSTTITNSSTVVLVGNGGGSESWGTGTIYSSGLDVTPNGYSYVSTDFAVLSGSTWAVTGDSGGAAFYYDILNQSWVLAGVIEATGTGTYSSGSTAYLTYCIDVAEYYDEISTVLNSAVPEPATWALAATGLGAVWWSRRRKQRRQGQAR